MNGEAQPFIDKVQNELGFEMVNPIKVIRAVNGYDTNKGKVGGVGEEAEAKVILAKYDELAGFVRKSAFKVKMGTFFDKKTKLPVENPKVILLVKVNGTVVEKVDNPDAPKQPLEVQVAEEIAEKKFEEVKAKRGRPRKEESGEVTA